jgi:hypothetical protein
MAEKEKPVPQLGAMDFQEAEYMFRTYVAEIEQGVTPEELLKQGYWAHHAEKLRPWDEIKARAKDGTWMAHLVVLDSSRTWAKVKQISFHRLATDDVSLTEGSDKEAAKEMEKYEVKWRGPAHKWCVVRKSDAAVLAEGRAKDEAQGWLEQYVLAEQGKAPPPDSVRV